MKESQRPYLLIAILILLWGSIAAVGKILLNGLDSFQVLFYTLLFSTIALGVIVFTQKQKRKIIFKYRRKDYLKFASIGIIGLFMYNALFYLALNFSSAQESFIVNYTWPMWTVLLAVLLLNEKLTAKKIFALFLSFIGVIIIVSNGSIFIFAKEHLLGNFLALVGAFFYGLFSILAKREKYDNISSMFFYFLFSLIFSFLSLLCFSNFVLINIKQILGFIWLGSISTGISYVIWIKALKIGNVAKLSNLILLTPFMSLVYIAILLKEKILTSSLLGLIFILVGILIQQTNKKKE